MSRGRASISSLTVDVKWPLSLARLSISQHPCLSTHTHTCLENENLRTASSTPCLVCLCGSPLRADGVIVFKVQVDIYGATRSHRGRSDELDGENSHNHQTYARLTAQKKVDEKRQNNEGGQEDVLLPKMMILQNPLPWQQC